MARNSPLEKGAAPKAWGLSGKAGRIREAAARFQIRCAAVRLSLIRKNNPLAAAPLPPFPRGNCFKSAGRTTKASKAFWRLPHFSRHMPCVRFRAVSDH